MTDMRDFETTSIHLAAAVLTHIPQADLRRISSDRPVDGKRLIVIAVPAEQAEAFQTLVEDFHRRRLTVPLYRFNRILNLLRDHLMQHKRPHAI